MLFAVFFVENSDLLKNLNSFWLILSEYLTKHSEKHSFVKWCLLVASASPSETKNEEKYINSKNLKSTKFKKKRASPGQLISF